MQRVDNLAEEAYWKIAVTGPSGTGKTTLGVTAPKPLIVLSERQALPSIKMAAKRLGVPVPPVVYVEEADDYRSVLVALHRPKDKPFVIVDRSSGEVIIELPVEEWPETVVIDSLTDACDVVRKELDLQAPDRKGRDGLPFRAGNKWGIWVERCMGIVKGFRDLPMHVVFLCLLSDKTKEDDDGNVIERIIQPKLATHAMGQQLAAAVNIMAYTYRTSEGAKLVYGVMTNSRHEGMLTKPCEPLQRIEVADLTSWIDRLGGNLVATPDFPVAPESEAFQEEPEEPTQPEQAERINDDGEATDEQEGPPVERCSECGVEPVYMAGDICAGCEAKIPAEGE